MISGCFPHGHFIGLSSQYTQYILARDFLRQVITTVGLGPSCQRTPVPGDGAARSGSPNLFLFFRRRARSPARPPVRGDKSATTPAVGRARERLLAASPLTSPADPNAGAGGSPPRRPLLSHNSQPGPAPASSVYLSASSPRPRRGTKAAADLRLTSPSPRKNPRPRRD